MILRGQSTALGFTGWAAGSLVKQTVLRGFPPEYVIDEQHERHVPCDDDAAIAAAIRDAVGGRI